MRWIGLRCRDRTEEAPNGWQGMHYKDDNNMATCGLLQTTDFRVADALLEGAARRVSGRTLEQEQRSETVAMEMVSGSWCGARQDEEEDEDEDTAQD